MCVGRGSVFSFTLPLALHEETLPEPAPSHALHGVRVLIVDDNELNRRVLHEQITSWGMRNGGSATPASALTTLASACDERDPYQIAILDYQMPEMDGEALARAIKADAKLRDTVLILLTSLGWPGDPERLKDAGLATCLVKPVRQSQLLNALATAWSGHQGAAAQPVRSAQPSSQQGGPARRHARVLVVDDNITNQKVASLMLEEMNCRVDVAANGREAIEMIELLPYDLVFMDCEMPVMDGFEATAEIRKRHASKRRIPIVAVTAKAMQGDRERCLAADMDDYVSKPVMMDELEAALDRWVGKPALAIRRQPFSIQNRSIAFGKSHGTTRAC